MQKGLTLAPICDFNFIQQLQKILNMSAIDNVLRQYGQKKDVRGLQDYMETLGVDELTDMVKIKLTHPAFPHTLNYIMQSFTDTSESHTKKFKVIMTILNKLETNDVSSTQSNAVVSRICIELDKLKSEHLVDICSFCLECIQKGNVTQMSWKELLPEVINVLMEREVLEHNGIEASGIEYKTQIINSLCTMQWSPSIVTSLAAMFVDMPLSKDEHLEITNKLGKCMEKLTPQEIPSFIYQLLKLCRFQNSKVIFLRLQNYFGSRVYQNTKTSDSESNSESMNLDVIVTESSADQNIHEAESTVLYHIYQSAFLGHESVKDYLSSLKNITKCPEFILHPFQLGVLLSISNVACYEEKTFDLIRFCISRALHEENRKMDSCWLRTMVPAVCKVNAVFSQIIEVSFEDRDLVVQGLVKLAFVLLGVGSALGRDVVAEKLWKLGSFILLKLVKRKRQVVPHVIQTLSDRILSEQHVNQYTECVYLLTKNMPLSMIGNLCNVNEFMEALVQIPESVATNLLEAIIPLTKVSRSIRDHLILLLRKALYSRVTQTRQVAVTGFLKLLKNLKVSNLAAVSQSSSSSGSFASGRSLFTQISLNQSSQSDSSTSNEALCLEVLKILKRCFMQQAEVKAQLYKELYNAVCMNPELGIPILDALWVHFYDYYVSDENSLPPLKFSNIHAVKDPDVILKEPIGQLVYTIGMIVIKVMESDDSNPTVKRFEDVIDSLVKRMISCELIHFELDDGTDLMDVVPESQQKVIVLKETLLVYEALIGYKIAVWSLENETCAQQINSLFQGYTGLIHFSKNITKPKKSDSKKKKIDADKSTQQTETTTKKETSNKSSKPFKLPSTLLDFKIINKILQTLHKPEVPWTNTVQANVIKTKVDFHRYVLQTSVELIQRYKNVRFLNKQDAKELYHECTEMASILYERCILRMKEFLDFDTQTAVLAAECFYNIILLITTQYGNNLHHFLSVVGEIDKQDELITHIRTFLETYKNIFDIEEEDANEDNEIKKLSVLSVNTITIFANLISSQSTIFSNEFLEWLKNYVNTKTKNNKQAASLLISLLFNIHTKFRPDMQLFVTVAVRLGDVMGTINEEEHSCEDFKMISDMLASSTLQSLCHSVKNTLDDVDWVINRLRAEYSLITYPGEECSEKRKDNIMNKERGITCQLCFLVSILTTLSNITIQPGPNLEAVLKNLIHLYNTLNCLTKYFISRSSKTNAAFQEARFERLVKLAGKQLSPVVYKLIMYIEESPKQTTQHTQNKKRSADSNALKSRVLRETRLIPKVIFEIEQFSKSIVQLSNKTKIDLAKSIGQGTVRDFRILNLKETLEHRGEESTGSTQPTSVAEESINETAADIHEESSHEDDSDGSSPQPAKRPKK